MYIYAFYLVLYFPLLYVIISLNHNRDVTSTNDANSSESQSNKNVAKNYVELHYLIHNSRSIDEKSKLVGNDIVSHSKDFLSKVDNTFL
jgi:hypothetical protein